MRKFMLALTALLTSVLLSAPAYAATPGDFAGGQHGGGRYPSITAALVSAIDDLSDVVGQVFSIIVSNPFFVLLVAAGLFTLGIRIFRKVKGAAKR